MLMLTKHSLDLRLAKDLELGKEAREPHRPSMDGVLSFPEGTKQGKGLNEQNMNSALIFLCTRRGPDSISVLSPVRLLGVRVQA